MRQLHLLLILILFMAELSISALSQRSAAPLAAKDRIVVVISLDGFPAYTFDDPLLPTPTLRRLAREGAVAQRMKISNPTVTWPNHTSMVTGVQPEKHGVLYNGVLMRGGPKTPPRVESSQPGTNMGRFFSAAATIHESFGSIW
jgi:predicted AlkP superfamily pyrophosphatase or phosphodiesterase